MRLSIIVPCYNEAESLPIYFEEMGKLKDKLDVEFEYIFVDDGSYDETLGILRKLQSEFPELIHYLSFSRNFGKESAIYAGLETATGDFITLMDADLQDPPELLIAMFEKFKDNPNLDCVTARRSSRNGEAFFKSLFSKAFYKIMSKISKTPVLDGVRDYRLMTRKTVNAILQLKEYNRFSKGLFSWVGFDTEYISYENHERVAGKTSWNFWGLLKYSIDGFVNFSEVPLQLAMYSGFLIVFFDIIAIIFLVIRQFVFHNSVSGWTSTIVVVLFCFGFSQLTLGVIGKYISSIFLEVKARPIYVVKEKK